MTRIRLLPFLLLTVWAGSAVASERGSIDPNNARGFQPGRLYHFTELDAISPFTGNLTVRIPIGNAYSVRPGFGYQMVLTYNSKVWDYEFMDADETQTAYYRVSSPEKDSNAGLGWLLSLGRIIPARVALPATANHGPIYLAPDGSRHELSDSLRSANVGNTATTQYTTDGTYIRATFGSTEDKLEFSGGEIHTFHKDGRLKQIKDQYGNWVKVTYGTTSAGGDQWTITDGYTANGIDQVARTNTVSFELAPSGRYTATRANFQQRVKTVSLAAFPAAIPVATYTFAYDDTEIQNGSCSDYIDDFDQPENINVPLLTKVTLPDGSSYVPQYNLTEIQTCTSGTMKELTLPTLGSVAWQHGVYKLPTEECSISPTTPESGRNIWSYDNSGVRQRTFKDANGNALATWSYVPVLVEGAPRTIRCGDVNYANQAGPPQVLRTTVTTMPAGDTTTHHFSAFRATGTTYNSLPSKRAEYGLPLTRTVESDGLFLSMIVKNAAGAEQRRTFVRYEGDGNIEHEQPLANVRVTAQRTVFLDDTGCTNASGGATPCQTQSERSGFDGFGHFRTEKTSSNFPIPATPGCATGDARETFTNYNPGLGPVSSWPLSSPWLLNTYTDTSLTERCVTRATLAGFDGFGSLQTSRTNSGAGDLMTATCRDARGLVVSERWFGGDGRTIPASPCSAAAALHSGAYVLDHAYTTTGGAITGHTAKYNSLGFFSVDETFDARTGFVASSRDTAGLPTTFFYDTSGRLKSVTPPGEETTSYVYSNATLSNGSFTPAQVSVTTGTGTMRVESRHQFDALGRPWREKQLMSDGTWSVRQTDRNGMGWTTATSELQKLEFTAPHTEYDFVPQFRTIYANFDAFGRPGLITAPDAAQVSLDYKGVREITRTRKVATSTTGEVWVSVREQNDAHGRLHKVTENSGSATDWIAATHTYDPAGRLTSVTPSSAGGAVQPARTFTYDGRGLLTEEWHPESGTAKLEYDAAGNVTRRRSAAGSAHEVDLRFAFDSAMRLQTVTQVGVGPLKELVYDRATIGTDYSMGKLDYAVAHNRQPLLGAPDTTVTETYTYAGVGGRLSSKKTAVSTSESFSDSYTYNTLGARHSVGYPSCTNCLGLTAPTRTVSNSYSFGFLTAAPGYASAIAYHPNGMLASIQHVNAGGTQGPLYAQTYNSASGIARPETISVSNFCIDFSVAQHPQSQTIGAGQSAMLSVSVPGATSFQWFTASNIAIAGATSSSITVTPSVTTSYWARAGNGSCTVDSATATVTVGACAAPSATITTVGSIATKGTATASVPETSGATYQWSIEGDATITSATSLRSVEFQAGCSGTVTLNVIVTGSCGAPVPGSTQVAIVRSTATINGSSEIAQGASTPISAVLSGQGPWTVTWSDGAPPQNAPQSPATRTVSPSETTSYSVTQVLDTHGCSGTTGGNGWQVTVTPPAPTGVNATAVTPNRVDLVWSYSGIADSFAVERRSAGGGYVWIGGTATLFFSDTTVAPNTAYVYRVRAVKAGTQSLPSTPDLATTMFFTDDPLVAGQTLVKAQHIAELRAAVNAVRATAGLAQATFSDATLLGVIARTLHIEEPRNALDQARSLLDLPPLIYTDGPLAVGTVIKRMHIEELRGGVK